MASVDSSTRVSTRSLNQDSCIYRKGLNLKTRQGNLNRNRLSATIVSDLSSGSNLQSMKATNSHKSSYISSMWASTLSVSEVKLYLYVSGQEQWFRNDMYGGEDVETQNVYLFNNRKVCIHLIRYSQNYQCKCVVEKQNLLNSHNLVTLSQQPHTLTQPSRSAHCVILIDR